MVIDEPGKKPYYGGLWAAPVFREIASESLQYLNIPSEKHEHISISKGVLDDVVPL